MKNHNGSPRLNHHHPANHTRDRNGRRGDWLWAVWLRFSLRDYGFCMAALLLFSLGSLFYQLNGGPPRLLLDMRQYLGKKTALSLSLSCCYGVISVLQHFHCVLEHTSCSFTSYSKFSRVSFTQPKRVSRALCSARVCWG